MNFQNSGYPLSFRDPLYNITRSHKNFTNLQLLSDVTLQSETHHFSAAVIGLTLGWVTRLITGFLRGFQYCYYSNARFKNNIFFLLFQLS
jgi:hypothetical protein